MTMHESLWGKIPDYRVDLEPNTKRIRVRFAVEIVAYIRRTLVVRETKHHHAISFPRAVAPFESLETTRHQPFLP